MNGGTDSRMKTLTVIDTFGFFFRSFYALPPLKNSEGFPTGLLTGFANLIHNLEKEYPTDYLLFALDAPGPSFRQKIDPNYKAQRPEAPPELKQQLPVAIEWIEKMGLSKLSLEGYEADDVIASMVKCAKEQGIRVRIVSHDKDLYQLIDDGRVVLFDPIKKVEIDEDACVQKYGIHPKQFTDYQALIGDSSDNVPGVPGIGPKTAVKLLTQFGTLDGIYDHIDEVKPDRIRNLLIEHKADAYRSRELVTLRDDIFDNCDLTAFRMPPSDPLLKIRDELKRYELRNILRRLGKETGETSAPVKRERQSFEAVLIDDAGKLFEILEGIDDETPVAIDTETDALDTKSAALVGFSFCFDESKAYYVPIAHNYLGVGRQIALSDAKRAFEILLKKRFFGHNMKFDLGLVYQVFGFDEVEPFADTMLLAWLVDPEGAVGLDRLALRYFDHDMVAFKDTVKKGENFSTVPIESATEYAAEDAWMSYRLYFKLTEMLRLQGAEHLIEEAHKVEYPFVNLLICMERHGIAIDIARFEELKEEISERLGSLTSQIYLLAGREFNINSPKQLGEILFAHLGLPGGKKTKSGGYSTNEKVLDTLKGEHPIIEKILDYRELHKLMSTYIDPLLKLGRKDPKHRIYTSFIQTGTATGRLSSKNPNLQNIPVKTEEGRRIREGFVASEGYLLAGIDYSQIELRFLAHFSGDPVLTEAFRQNKDIHMETAVKLFGAEEAQAKRNIAKTVNFGLLYGMGSRKLAQTLGISTKEAKAIIENYFASFPTVKAYLESIEAKAKEQGYVETLLGRRRYFDFEHANAMQLAAYLREAGNTVFQGSTADLIKMAMLNIHRVIKEESLDAAILLQIHDELIFEIKSDDAEALAGRFSKMMEETVTLDVPLKTSINIGYRWSELK
ncbi:DNA polymerase I [Hydrogenimonas cancrithermarum]|uniref:DNA polymerase I n=1 Tax=Hydrogenimonas cancrithermarum TaxID=2993563 RepID=A0ABM8FLP2_9BACT|nr:DNA polymerase I [Hydrogenimonas cancrithermarum]BDY12309.1 DNA polymerase [Hydrogenimonas cancrithermarum]